MGLQKRFIKGLGFLLIILFLSVSCRNQQPIQEPQQHFTQTPTSFLPVSITPTRAELLATEAAHYPSEPTDEAHLPTDNPLTPVGAVYIDQRLPNKLVSGISALMEIQPQSADNTEFNIGISDNPPLAQWIFCAAVPFPTLEDGTTFEDIQKAWTGGSTNGLTSRQLYLAPETAAALIAWWGLPAPNAFEIVDPAILLQTAWENQPSWVILPFEALDPLWKVITVDGINPIHNTFSAEDYPLTLQAGISGSSDSAEHFLSIYPEFSKPENLITNRNAAQLTNLMITGVTALVRATAVDMENKGITYPAQSLGDLLASADITHISNEVPFAENCPYPDSYQIGVRFCSDTDYIELLRAVGTDIVELTGDHFADWGTEAMLLTLEMYAEEGWPVYGGGETSDAARQPVVMEHNGNKIAFIGCNGKGPPFSQASENNPGSVTCDYPFVEEEIARLTSEGHLVIVTYQHHEYYTYATPQVMAKEFDRMAEAGASVVSGSQAHHPHNMSIINGGFVHYGLGNMFFDQFAVGVETRQSFIDRHVFYQGRYISTELIPILFVDFSRPRLMTESEADDLLQILFDISDWQIP